MTVPSFDTAFAVFFAVAVLAILVERGLSVVFEHPLYLKTLERFDGIKEIVALAVCYSICKYIGFDSVSLITNHPDVHPMGLWITAATMAGGSKGSNHLFVNLLGIQSAAAKKNGNGAAPPPKGG